MKKYIFILICLLACFFVCACKCENNNYNNDSAMVLSGTSETMASTTEINSVVQTSFSNYNNTELYSEDTKNTECIIDTNHDSETSIVSQSDISAPPILSVSNIDCTTNKLSWNAVDGAELYILYLFNKSTSEFEKYAEVKQTSCKDKELTPNTEYIYAVSAVFPDGTISELSESKSIYTENQYGNNIANLNFESDIVSNSVTGQGNIMYILPDNGSMYKIDKNEGKADIVNGNWQNTHYINVIGNNLYYYRETLDGYNNEKCICSYNIDGNNEQIILSLSDECFSEYKAFDSCYIDYLYAVNSTLYFRVYTVPMHDFPATFIWYSVDTRGGVPKKLYETTSKTNIQIIYADENSLVLGSNYCEVLGYDDDCEIFGEYVYEYGLLQTFSVDGETVKEQEMALADDLSQAQRSALYKAYNGTYYICDISNAQIYPIGELNSVYQHEDFIYYTTSDGVFEFYNGQIRELCTNNEHQYRICYADYNDIVIERNCFYKSENVHKTEYWILNLNSLSNELLISFD